MEKTLKELGYYFPAEWEEHRATWLSFPHNRETWPDPFHDSVLTIFADFVKALSLGEEVHILCPDESGRQLLQTVLESRNYTPEQVVLHRCPTNDAWCRDYGPAFLVNPQAEKKKVIVDWEFNAWGEKYYPYEQDNAVPTYVADYLNLPRYAPGVVMEGGAVEFNGAGAVLTTASCLLNPSRNPKFTKRQIEWFLNDYYGVDQVIWLEEGLRGGDTDSHIDEITRFVDTQTVLTTIAHEASDENYEILKNNAEVLANTKLRNGQSLEVKELPLPAPLYLQNQRMPASYANFYIANGRVIVPIFKCKTDDEALTTIRSCFPDREIIPLDSSEVIWGLGSFHCLSQQEPSGSG